MLGGSVKDVGLEKLKYTSVPSEDVNKLFNADYLIQEKVDGASMLFHLLADKIEALSYRASKTGRPIIHTYRVFGPTGGKMGVKIPKELQGTILRGEVYGEREGKSIPPQELGGILNASVENSLEKQRTGKVRLKNMIFDVARLGKETGLSLGAKERQTKLQEIMTYLPKDRFSLPETAETPEAAKDLWERITTGKHPRTREGIVAWPTQAGVPPVKVKLLPESDVFINKIFPGEGKFKDIGAGGFEYSLKPGGETIGKVGTGFSDQARKEMLTDPESWVGRVARIRSQSQFPITGAHRAPSFIARHEDYPVK
jgi:ATP-dependent DNA ligase